MENLAIDFTLKMQKLEHSLDKSKREILNTLISKLKEDFLDDKDEDQNKSELSQVQWKDLKVSKRMKKKISLRIGF